MFSADSDGSNDDEEESNIGTIEVVVLRYNKVPKIRKHQRSRIIGRELVGPVVESHPRSKKYWKNWAAEQECHQSA